MPLLPALSEFKLRLIQYIVFQIVVRDGGGAGGGGGLSEILVGWIFLPGEGTKSMKLEQKWNRSNDYS